MQGGSVFFMLMQHSYEVTLGWSENLIPPRNFLTLGVKDMGNYFKYLKYAFDIDISAEDMIVSFIDFGRIQMRNDGPF